MRRFSRGRVFDALESNTGGIAKSKPVSTPLARPVALEAEIEVTRVALRAIVVEVLLDVGYLALRTRDSGRRSLLHRRSISTSCS